MQDFGPALAPQARAPWRSPTLPAARSTPAPIVVGGRYQLLDVIARGGMATVYRAIQRGLDRQVALKLLPRPRGRPDARQRELERRFEAEARFGGQLSHPHVVRVIDAGRDRQHLFLAMEWVRGESLHRLMRQTRLRPEHALQVAWQVGSAISAMHNEGALHRDVKPGNIVMKGAQDGLVGDQGHVWATLLDLGLVKEFDGVDQEQTQLGRKLGTPGYMSPQQALGQEVDARLDVYGLGAVLFEMLVGRPLYPGADARETMRAQIQSPVPSLLTVSPGLGPSRLPTGLMPMPLAQAEALDALVKRALAKDPGQRYATMASMVAAIEAAQATMAPRPSV